MSRASGVKSSMLKRSTGWELRGQYAPQESGNRYGLGVDFGTT
jgi:hypothetical protein